MTPTDSDRLTFKPFQANDLDRLVVMNSDPGIMQGVGREEPPSREHVANWLDKTMTGYRIEGLGQMGVYRRESGELIGRCGLRTVEIEAEPVGESPRWFWFRDSAPRGMNIRRETEIGYAFSSPYWGKGYGTEAVRAFCEYGLALPGTKRIVAATFPENNRSARVLAKAGFAVTGTGFGLGRRIVTHTLFKQSA